MLNVSLDRAVDLSTAAFVGFLSVSGIMSSYKCPIKTPSVSSDQNSEESQTSITGCPVSPCSRTNLRFAVSAGLVTSGLYLYRGIRG